MSIALKLLVPFAALVLSLPAHAQTLTVTSNTKKVGEVFKVVDALAVRVNHKIAVSISEVGQVLDIVLGAGHRCGILETLVTDDALQAVQTAHVSLSVFVTETTVSSDTASAIGQLVTTLTFPPGGVLSIVGDSVVYTSSSTKFSIAVKVANGTVLPAIVTVTAGP